MIFDHRTYTAKPNMLPHFLKLYEDVGLPMQRHYLGEPFGFFQTHIGDLSRTVHLWQYESLADREARRDRASIEQYGKGCPDDAIEHHLYTRWATGGPVLLLVVLFLLFGDDAGLWENDLFRKLPDCL